MRNNRIFTILAVVVVLFSTQTSRAAAQEASFSLIVAPSQAYLKILPNNRANHTIILENSGNDTLEVTPKVLDFATDGKTGIPILLGKTEFAYLNLTDALYQPITLAPHTKAQLTLSFTIPSGAKNKEYPLSVLFSARKTGTGGRENEESPVTGSVVSNLVVLVSDESAPTKKVVLSHMDAPRFLDSFAPIEFIPTVKNEAYAATVASGSASLYNWRGKKLAEFPFYPDSILGFSSRELRSYIQSEAADTKNTTISPRLFSFKAPFLFGPYKLEFLIDNSTEKQQAVIAKHVTILALPFSLILVTVIGVATYFVYNKLAVKFSR